MILSITTRLIVLHYIHLNPPWTIYYDNPRQTCWQGISSERTLTLSGSLHTGPHQVRGSKYVASIQRKNLFSGTLKL